MESNIIYEVPCRCCPGRYIGQTKNYLTTIISAHESDCKNVEQSESTALSKHRHALRHKFQFNDLRILDSYHLQIKV